LRQRGRTGASVNQRLLHIALSDADYQIPAIVGETFTTRDVGEALRSRTGGRQTTEVAIAVASLNRMLEIGRPVYVRLT